MAQSPFNRGEISQAVARLLGMKTAYAPQVDALLSPTLNLGDLENTPYLKIGVPVGRALGLNPVAAQNSWVWAQPGAKVALQISKIWVASATAGTIIVKALGGDVANVFAPVTASLKFIDMGPSDSSGGLAWGAFRSSSLNSITIASTIGEDLARIVVLANTSYEITLPGAGFTLWGNDPAGIPALGVTHGNVNVTLTVTMLGREWPLPG